MTRTSLLLAGAGSLLLVVAGCTKDDDVTGDSVIGDSGGIVTDEDTDGDGVNDDEDCAPEDATIYPGAEEICDGVDNDCDDEIDEDVMETYYRDADADGFGDPGDSAEACERPDGYVPSDAGEDCDDTDASIYPDAPELCDGIDNDCNGVVDDDLDTQTYYADTDGDGFGDPNAPETLCEEASGYVENDLDCDDADYGEPVIVAAGASPGDTGWDSGDSGWWDSGDSGWIDTGIDGSGTAADPFTSIQDGIDLAEVCVHVYEGSYYEDIDFTGKDIEVVGIGGSSETTIWGSGNDPVVSFSSGEPSTALLQGFTITGGGGLLDTDTATSDCGSGGETCTTTTLTYRGGGVYVNGADPTLDDLVLTGILLPPFSYTELSATETVYVYSFGGGYYVADGNVAATNITAVGNFADAGGGGYVDGGGIVTTQWATFDSNSASAGGGVGSVGDFNATNAVFINNASADNSGVFGGAALDVAAGTTYITNATLAGNDGLASSYLSGSSSTNVINSIAVVNDEGPLWDYDGSASVSVMYGDTFGGTGNDWGSLSDPTGTDGNIAANPLFVSWTNDGDSSDDDLHLDAGSPAIDAGSPAGAFNDADGSTNDQGAYGGPDGSW
ncbi:MAG: hypothetical protein GY913_20080 [Proteobacteria bacterium]|nr:hypothetical protein [Pseudomonadota bacterium]MCP4919205.1 hypothetical protein [Pseudomonadota bacterium]